MIDLEEAKNIVAANTPPDTTYLKHVKYANMFIFIVVLGEDGEQFAPVFVSVDDKTGAFRDIQPWEVSDPQKLEQLLMEAE